MVTPAVTSCFRGALVCLERTAFNGTAALPQVWLSPQKLVGDTRHQCGNACDVPPARSVMIIVQPA